MLPERISQPPKRHSSTVLIGTTALSQTIHQDCTCSTFDRCRRFRRTIAPARFPGNRTITSAPATGNMTDFGSELCLLSASEQLERLRNSAVSIGELSEAHLRQIE